MAGNQSNNQQQQQQQQPGNNNGILLASKSDDGGPTENGENGDQQLLSNSPLDAATTSDIQQQQLVATISDGRNHVVSVPVSVGSLIGTAFNVIGSDQLQPHFKQVLCVDSNGFIAAGNTIVSTSGGAIDAPSAGQSFVLQPDASLNGLTLQPQPNAESIVIDAATTAAGGADGTDEGDDLLNGLITMSTSNNAESDGAGEGPICWETVGNLEMLPVRCKSITAELYKSRLGSGGRGRCLKFKNEWMTPSEFENMCGRGSSKDWKRSIRYGGRSLQALIDEGVLTPHATSCTCAACADDDTSNGPVRLFTPYKRRRRNQATPDSTRHVPKARKMPAEPGDAESEENEPTSCAITIKDESNWQNIADGLDITSNEFMNSATAAVSSAALAAHVAQNVVSTVNIQQTQQQQQQPEANHHQYVFDACASNVGASQPFDRLTTLCAQMTKATNEFRRCINEAKEMHQRQIEKLQQERDAALLAARAHDDMDDPGNSGGSGGVEMPASKKVRCANCNREAMAECSLCRRTPYCSTFCQRKDWNAHQVECSRDPNDGAQQIMLLVEDS